MKFYPIALAILLAFPCLVHAQSETYKNFKVDLDLGRAAMADSRIQSSPFDITIEPHYRLSDNLMTGLRFEFVVGSQQFQMISGGYDVGQISLDSYVPTADYYILTRNKFRFSVGAGVGAFKRGAESMDPTYYITAGTITSDNHFRPLAMLRIANEFGHSHYGITYNYVSQNRSYISGFVGFSFGGGFKD